MSHPKKMLGRGSFIETIGDLTGLTEDQEFLVARIGDEDLELPFEMKDKLLPLMGKCIGILQTDIPGKEYLVCSISETKSPASDEVDVMNATLSNAHKGRRVPDNRLDCENWRSVID